MNDDLANFIIAGVNKSGSTSVFHYLESHPDICGSSVKETCYFLPVLYQGSPGPISEYRSYFRHCRSSRYRMESTPAYLFGGRKMAETIREALGEIRILVILKDPVERLKSFYKRKKSTLQLPSGLNFNDYVEKCMSFSSAELDLHENQIYTGIYLGLYSESIEPWFNVYGSNFKVVFFDQLKNNPVELMHDLCKWLGIDPGFYDSYDFDVRNKSVNYKNRGLHRLAVSVNEFGNRIWRNNPGLKSALLRSYYLLNGKPVDEEEFDQETIRELYDYYEPYNRKLYTILTDQKVLNLPIWLKGQPVSQ